VGPPSAYSAAPMLSASATFNPGAVADAAGITSSAISVPGAALGDFVDVAAPYDLQGVAATAYVASPDSVRIRLTNLTGSLVTLGNGSWNVRVRRL